MSESTNLPALSRRRLLQGAAAVTAGAALAGPTRALAQSKGRIVVGTWGGDYARLLRKNIEQPLLIDKGWEVIQDQLGDPERRSKMLAEKRLARGTSAHRQLAIYREALEAGATPLEALQGVVDWLIEETVRRL